LSTHAACFLAWVLKFVMSVNTHNQKKYIWAYW
jgi:hypothetical protein